MLVRALCVLPCTNMSQQDKGKFIQTYKKAVPFEYCFFCMLLMDSLLTCKGAPHGCEASACQALPQV